MEAVEIRSTPEVDVSRQSTPQTFDSPIDYRIYIRRPLDQNN